MTESPEEYGEHLRLLGIFHFVVAGLAALFACLPMIHLAIGVSMIVAPEAWAQGAQPPPPPFVGWILAAIGAAIVLAGWVLAACIAYAGRCLLRRERRLYCLVVAGIETMFMPFGTVLGVLALVVLLKPEARALFRS